MSTHMHVHPHISLSHKPIPVCFTQVMETSFPDILHEDESVAGYVQVAGKGKGLVQRAREYVRGIAKRYVCEHHQQLMELQHVRRLPANSVSVNTIAPSTMSALATVTLSSSAPSMFNDNDWTTVFEDIQVQEVDGTWRDVTLFRSVRDAEHVCIWFGGDEYEGIDPSHPYRWCPRTEILEDDEGFDIN